MTTQSRRFSFSRFSFPHFTMGKILWPTYAHWLFLLFTLNCLILQSQLVAVAWHGGHADFVRIGTALGALSLAAVWHLSPGPKTGWAFLVFTSTLFAGMGWVLTGVFHTLMQDAHPLPALLVGFSPESVMGRILLPFFSASAESLPPCFALGAGLFWSAFLLISLALQVITLLLPFKAIRKRFWIVRLAYGCVPVWFMNFSGYPVFSPGYGARFLAEALDYAELLAQRYLAVAADRLLSVLLWLVDVPALLPPLPRTDQFSAWGYPAEEWGWFVVLLAVVPLMGVCLKRLGKDCAWTPIPNTAA